MQRGSWADFPSSSGDQKIDAHEFAKVHMRIFFRSLAASLSVALPASGQAAEPSFSVRVIAVLTYLTIFSMLQQILCSLNIFVTSEDVVNLFECMCV